MTEEEARGLLRKGERPGRTSMNGIGVANVHRRLKLVYGQKCGLSVLSEKGVRTEISVRILKEGGEEDIPYSLG